MARLVLVHDDETARQPTLDLLERQGHQVLGVPSAELGQALAARRYDIVVVGLGGLLGSGVELLSLARRYQPDCATMLLGAPADLGTVIDAVNRAQVSRIVREGAGEDGLVRAVREVMGEREDLVGMLGRRRLELERREAQALRHALSPELLHIAVQPIVDAASHELFAVEVLARSQHPSFRSTPQLVAAAERHQLLDTLTHGVVQRLAGQIGLLPSQARIFLNLHPAELENASRLLGTLAPLFPHAHRVVIEITERGAAPKVDAWVRAVEELYSHGFAIALDDLGAGSASLRMLAELQPHFLKIDLSIVRDVDVEASKQRLVSLLCQFAVSADAKVIAEGVETRPEAEELARCGAHYLQGYLFGRPAEPALGG